MLNKTVTFLRTTVYVGAWGIIVFPVPSHLVKELEGLFEFGHLLLRQVLHGEDGERLRPLRPAVAVGAAIILLLLLLLSGGRSFSRQKVHFRPNVVVVVFTAAN